MPMTLDNTIMDNLTLEKTLETIPSGLFVVNDEMQVVYWNPAAELITGYSAEEAVGQHCSFLQGIPCGEKCGLFSPDIPKPIIGADCTIVTKSGKTVYLLKNMEHLYDDANNVIGGIESFIDITRQRSLELSLRDHATELESRVEERTRELKKSEARFRTVLDNMDDMAYIATEDFRLTFMNRAMREVFGDKVGEPCYEVLHGEGGACSWCPMQKVLKNRTLRDERQFGNDGRLYEVIHSPLPAEDGLKQKLAVCRDITERDQAEKDLQQANRELDAFAHSVSHDLRGILAPVVTYLDFLRLTYADVFDEQIMEILAETERQSERAIALLDDLLDLAQVSHIKLGEHPIEPNKIVDEVLRELQLEKRDHPEIIVDTLQKTWLPEPLVYQIFSNLIGNACRYVPAESDPIKVGCWDEAHQVTFYVQDHGPGVPQKESEQIFEIFYRGKTSKNNRGTGVGLAIVRKIAIRCNGKAWVEQTPGGGATFCVSLPKTPAFGQTKGTTP